MTLLEVSGLAVSYGGQGLLSFGAPRIDAALDISFTLPEATTYAVVGESGSGKSTLGRAIMGLTPVQSGTIRLSGQAMPAGEGNVRVWRRQMAMMFQDAVASLSPRMTTRQLITEPFDIHGFPGGRFGRRERDAEARRLLALVGLPVDFADRYPHQLSGGQARRVGAARALALSPRLIIADEPTAGLDVSVQGEILNLLRRLQDETGLSYLLITHNLAVVRHISERMAVMYMGRFMEEGPTADIYAAPAHPYTHGLLSAQPDLDPDKRRADVELKGEVPSLAARPPGCEFHTRCPHAQPRCQQERPEARGIGGRAVRCHFPLEF
ncbi:oligopeptide/dipeptide ABC transporter ATP-binding protein [Acidisoma sp. C75]